MSDARRDAARAPLRALRQEPLLVDGRRAAERLRPSVASGALSGEDERWARAWLVCAHAALVADPRHGLDEPWTIALPLDGVRAPRGGGERGRVAAILAALTAAGLLHPAGDGAGGADGARARLDRGLFTAHQAAIALDWPGLVAACGAEPAALLVLHALAGMVVPLDAWTAVPRRDLVAATGYRQKQVRVALQRLAAAGLLEVEGDAGVTARYRFTDRARGRAWPSAAEAAPPLAATPPAPPPPSAAAPEAAAGLRVRVGGATVTLDAGAALSVGAGMSARLELDADGRPVLVVEPPAR